jgi:ferredoxin-NADP reductase
MLRHALAIPHRNIGLFYSARTPQEFAFEREFRELAAGGDIELRQTVTRASEAELDRRARPPDARRTRRTGARSGHALFHLRAAGAGQRDAGDPARTWHPARADQD